MNILAALCVCPSVCLFVSIVCDVFFFWYSAVHNSRSITPITWQAAVDDEEQRPLLQDILEAAVDDRRQAAVDVCDVRAGNSKTKKRTKSKLP